MSWSCERGCQYSDAWRCAKTHPRAGRIACDCVCHRYLVDTREKILAKPPAVRQVILMIATKQSVMANAPNDDASHVKYCRAALEHWECIVAPRLRAEAPEVSENDLAVLCIDQVRSDPANTWSKILRKGTN